MCIHHFDPLHITSTCIHPCSQGLRIATFQCHQSFPSVKLTISQEPHFATQVVAAVIISLISPCIRVSHSHLQVSKASPQARPFRPPPAPDSILLCCEDGRSHPQAELRRCQNGKTTTCHAHRAVAESQVAQTHGHGDEPGKEEDAVGEFDA